MKDYYCTRSRCWRCRQAPMGGRLQPMRPALLSRGAVTGQSTRPPIDSSNGLSIDSSIDLSVVAATALAPSLVGHPTRHHTAVGRRIVIGSGLEAGLGRAARQMDPLAFGVSQPLDQRAAGRSNILVLPCDSSQCSAQTAPCRRTHLVAVQPESAGVAGGDQRSRNAFLRFKPRANPGRGLLR
jgi:hypothetical protein